MSDQPERKIDYFGTFLKSMKSGPRPGETPSQSAARTPAEPDPLNEVLKTLKSGGRSARDLIPLTGNSVTEFLKVRNQLVELGWVSLSDGDALELTPKGAEVAALLA